jgi:hypothetical protein
MLLAEFSYQSGGPMMAKSFSANNGSGLFAYGLAIHSGNRIALTGIVEETVPVTFAVELNESGNVNWSKKLNSANELSSTGYGICKGQDFGYLVCGSRTGIDNSTVQIIKISNSGSVACVSTDFPLTGTDLILNPSTEVFSIGASTLIAQDIALNEIILTDFQDACQPMSTGDEFAKEYFSVYPNPSDGRIFINLHKPGTYKVKISNVSGSIIYENDVLEQGINELMHGFSSGIYFLQLFDGENISCRKIIIR